MAPCSPQPFAPSLGHANRGAVTPARGLPCWRLAPRKPLRLRRATPTETPFPRHAASPVGALLPASPFAFVRPRQQRRRSPGARPSMLAPCFPQALAPSSGHANSGGLSPAHGLPGSRPPAGKANKFGFRARTLERKEAEKQPGLRFGSRLPAGKANEFGSRARTLERKEAEKQPGLRFGSRPPAGKANKFGFRARTLERKEAEKKPGLRSGSRPPAGKANKFGFRARTAGPECVKQKTQEFPSTSLNEC